MKIALDSEVVRTKGSPSSVVIAALAEYLGTPVHTVFQVSTSRALVAGVYSGVVRVQAILDHGDFGLGTFANLDSSDPGVSASIESRLLRGSVTPESRRPCDGLAAYAVSGPMLLSPSPSHTPLNAQGWSGKGLGS